MSLTSLKKTMAQMDAEQLRSLVAELYQARPEAKEYLDFFVLPDIDKRLDKTKTAIRKELMRTSRGHNRGRSTRVRRFIKDISSLNPGAEHVVEIMTYAVETAAEVGSSDHVKDTTQHAVARLLGETVRLADAAGQLDLCVGRLRKAIEAMSRRVWYSRQYRELLQSALDDAIDSL